jgi:hypothetical protein
MEVAEGIFQVIGIVVILVITITLIEDLADEL